MDINLKIAIELKVSSEELLRASPPTYRTRVGALYRAATACGAFQLSDRAADTDLALLFHTHLEKAADHFAARHFTPR